MKRIFIYLTLIAATLSGCSKSDNQQTSKGKTDGMKIVISFDNLTKDSSGLFTPVDRNGVVWIHRGYIRLIAVAVDAADNPDFSNYIESTCEIESYYGNMVVGMTNRTTADWFAHSPTGKCIFFADIQKDPQSRRYEYRTRIYNSETQSYDDAGWAYADTKTIYPLKDAQDNIISLLPLVYVRPEQRTEIDYYDDYGQIYREVNHIIGACSMDAIAPAHVLGNKNTLTLSAIAPANTLLRFNIKRSEDMSDFNLRNLKISMESGDGEAYHSLQGYAFMDFRNYTNAANPFTIIGRKDLAAMTGEDILSIEYPALKTIDENGDEVWSEYRPYFHDAYIDEINCYYDDDEKDYEERYIIPVSSTPSEQWLLVSIIPQSAAASAGSKLVFKAYDANNNLVGSAVKDFPAEGFIGGNQYEFTLTLTSASSPVDADSSGAGTYYQGDEITEE